MKKALVLLDGRIAEIRNDEFPVHPDLKWVDVPDDTVVNFDRYKNGQVEKYIPLTRTELAARDLAVKRVAALAALDQQRLITASVDLNSPQAVKDYHIALTQIGL